MHTIVCQRDLGYKVGSSGDSSITFTLFKPCFVLTPTVFPNKGETE